MKLAHLLAITLFGTCLLAGCAQKACNLRSDPVKTGKKKSYTIKGKTYYPLKEVRPGHVQDGVASWYGPKFNGRKTACGEIYNMHDLTAASPVLPMHTLVRVTNMDNDRQVVVRINDRGPFVDDRVIDLSFKAARHLAMVRPGTAPVRIEVLGDRGRMLAKKTPAKAPPPATLAAPNPYYKAFADKWIAVSRRPARNTATHDSSRSIRSRLGRLSDWLFS